LEKHVKRKTIMCLAGLGVALGMAGSANAATTYYVKQDGVLRGSITAYSGAEDGAENYDFDDENQWSANLHHGPTLSAGRAHLFLYQQNNGGLYFTVVFNRFQNGSGGNASWSLSLSGNTSTASVQVSDDPDRNGTPELSGSGSSFSGSWVWMNSYTDGGVIGPLSGAAWELTITLNSGSFTDIYAYSGDGSSIALSASGGDITIYVPEPRETGMAAALLLGAAAWRRWRSGSSRCRQNRRNDRRLLSRRW
jgi:hypothetical protein